MILPYAAWAEEEGIKATEPQMLTELRENYQKAVDSKITPLQEYYLKHLNRLMENYTCEKKLDEAIAVRDEIKKITEALNNNGASQIFAKKAPIVVVKKTEEETLKSWLQEHEIYWGSSGNEVVLRFDGEQVAVIVNGKQSISRKYILISPAAFQVNWSSGVNVFTQAPNKRGFTRRIEPGGVSSEVQVRKSSEKF